MVKNSFFVISRLFIGLWIPRQYISIVIPVYEMKGSGAKYLKDLLETIFLQKYKNYEIVISDDSKDDVIQQYIQSFNRDKKKIIKYCKNPGIAGISSNLNNGIKHASGQIIKVMFQDDMFASNKALLELNRAYHTFPNKVWAIEGSSVLSGVVIKESLTPEFNPYMLLGINTFSSPSTLSFRKNSICNFNENLFMLMDVEIYARLNILYGDPIVIKNNNVINRLWEGQAQNSIDALEYLRELKIIAADYPKVVTKKYINSAINSLNGVINKTQLESLRMLSHSITISD
jgi:glycosyltransferase involved in cell wall biosynthesis